MKTIEEQIAELEEAAARYRNNATLPHIKGTPIAQGQITQAQAFEGQIEVLKNQLLNPIKEQNIPPNSLNQLGEQITKPTITPLLLVGGLVVAAIVLKN